MDLFQKSENNSSGSQGPYDYKSLGERIEIARGKEKQGIFAKKLGKQQSYVSKIENGNQKPTPEDIYSICKIYSINEKWLLTGEGSMEAVGERKGNPEIARRVAESNEGHRKVVAEYEAFKKKIHDDLELVLERGEGHVTEELVDNIDDCAQKIRAKDRSWFFKKKKAAGE